MTYSSGQPRMSSRRRSSTEGWARIVGPIQEESASDVPSLDAGLPKELRPRESTSSVQEERADDGDFRVSLRRIDRSGEACRCEPVIDVQLTNVGRLVGHEGQSPVPVGKNSYVFVAVHVANSRVLRGQISCDFSSPVRALVVD